MSDNPTLWKQSDPTQEDIPALLSELLSYVDDYYVKKWRLDEAVASVVAPERADVLAALPDKEWWCVLYAPHVNGACTPDNQHEGEGCHWAVKPC